MSIIHPKGVIKKRRFSKDKNPKDYPALPTKQHLKASEVEYLAFEGGGGKGNAFIGAIEAMEGYQAKEKNKTEEKKTESSKTLEKKKGKNIIHILKKKPIKNGIELTVNKKKKVKKIEILDTKRVKGIAGSSAGAITALFLSMGMSSEDMKYFMDILDMEEVEKPSKLGNRPVLYARNAELSNKAILINQILRNKTFKDEFRTEHKKLTKKYERNSSPESVDVSVSKLSRKQQKKDKSIKQYWYKIYMKDTSTEKLKAIYFHRLISNFLVSGIGKTARFMLQRRRFFNIWMVRTIGSSFTSKMYRLFWQEYNKALKGYTNPNTLLYWIQLDKGYLTGSHLHSFFDFVMAQRIFEVLIARGDNSKVAFNKVKELNFTFQELYDVFGVNLVITGSNLSTGKSGLFSCAHTPHFPVATAVRISMSLPIYFKPVIITEKNPYGLGKEYYGHWWDGGLFNNAPFRVFDYLHPTSPKPKTLLIRLERDKPKDLEKFSEFFKAYLMFMMGNGESHVSLGDPRFNQFITLKTSGYSGGSLSTFNFKETDQNKLKHYYAEARKAVFEYFEKSKTTKS